MLFARTIRRKLLVVLALVLCMLLTLSVSGISGLSSFREVVRELDNGLNNAPHQADLVAAINLLVEPIQLHIPNEKSRDMPSEKTRVAAARKQAKIVATVHEVEQRIVDIRRKLERLPPGEFAAGQLPVANTVLGGIEKGLKRLEDLSQDLTNPHLRAAWGEARVTFKNLAPELLSNVELRDDTTSQMSDQLMDLQKLAQKFPDPGKGLIRTLEEAREVYRSKLVIVWVTTAVVFALFLTLVRYGYVWIFTPIHKLHQGALRVAHGDFDYRVQLATRDEMAELAQAFNEMTSRFQEIAADLDRQVQERSRQLVRSERLAGVGFLAAGVAHEINNPLSAIAMAAESLEGRIAELLQKLPDDEARVVRQYLQMMQDESFRCKQITERLLDFSRGRDAVREQADLTRLTSEVVAMVQYLSKYREKKIEFSREAPCYAEVNAPEIKQVVLNLVANGLEAMERGGTLRIDILEQTDHVVLQFADEGCGMTPEVLENMFEPFFTRKQSGQGTGLGLSISHRIISQHGGTISAVSAGAGQGSTFSVRLPRRANQQAAA